MDPQRPSAHTGLHNVAVWVIDSAGPRPGPQQSHRDPGIISKPCWLQANEEAVNNSFNHTPWALPMRDVFVISHILPIQSLQYYTIVSSIDQNTIYDVIWFDTS